MIASASVARFDGLFRSSERSIHIAGIRNQLPIDLDTYRQLRNHIAKALVPLLQIWLYATRDDGLFEKRYSELCQILDIRQWTYPSKIKEKLGPSPDELKQFGYLADWRIETTSDQQGYKVLFFHGETFHSDRRARQARKQLSNRPPRTTSETRPASIQYKSRVMIADYRNERTRYSRRLQHWNTSIPYSFLNSLGAVSAKKKLMNFWRI
jgi:hypothetical protein